MGRSPAYNEVFFLPDAPVRIKSNTVIASWQVDFEFIMNHEKEGVCFLGILYTFLRFKEVGKNTDKEIGLKEVYQRLDEKKDVMIA